MKKLFSLLLGSSFIVASWAQGIDPKKALPTSQFEWDDMFKIAPKPAAISKFTADGRLLITQKSSKKTWWIITNNPATKQDSIETLFHSDWFSESVPQGGYTFSADHKFMVLETNTKPLFRHTYTAEVWVINLQSKQVIKVPGRAMNAALSPDNQRVAYVRDNNLFIYDFSGTPKEIQVTSDGKFNHIINGAVDWVYEEEFSMSQGFYWSPSGSKIAYYRFDESQVKEFSMDIFTGLYPQQEKWKYPKAGEDNSKVDVFIYDLKSANSEKLPLEPANPEPGGYYIPRFQWLHTDDYLTIQRLNRHQNHWELLLWQAQTKNLRELASERDSAYVEIVDELMLLPKTTQLIYTSEKSGYNHMYRLDYLINKKTFEWPVTSGNWQVNKIVGYSPEKNLIYYTSTEFSTVEDHLYSISPDGRNKTAVLNPKEKMGAPLSGNQTVMASPNCHWMYVIESNFSENPIYLTHLLGPNQYKTTQSDETYTQNVQLKNPGSVTFGEIPYSALEQGIGPEMGLNYWMLKPANFDPTKKYPLLMYVYGGPGNSICRNSRNGYFAWYQHLAAKGYIVVCVDNRGTGNKGAAFKKCTYQQLGKIEHLDQRAAAKYLGNLPYIDANRIGIWGWSFGGYMSSLCITKSSDVFKTAIAVAPVTHWKYYDNIYTERYLRTPQENPTGYEENSPLNFADQIKGNYLIVHGTADDNVHFQNAVEMVNKMIKANVEFDSEYYPNRNHGIGDGAARKHLFKKLTEYILENL